MAINIDNQLSLEYTFRIANKPHKLTFSDDCALDMEKVNLKVDKIMQNLEKMDDNELEEKSVDEQTEIMKNFYEELRDSIIPFFDEYMDDSGQEIYEYYKESTRALAVVFRKVYDYLSKVEITKKTDSKSKVTPMK